MITHTRLKELLEYDPITGYFVNKVARPRAPIGARAGSATGHGYRKICIDGCRYYEHHLAWFYETGEWPEELDHKDGIRSRNSFENLRPSTRSLNNFNGDQETGSSGLRGAYWNVRGRYWYSKIQVGGQVKWLGIHATAEDAHLVYQAAADQIAGEYAFHNREQQHQPLNLEM